MHPSYVDISHFRAPYKEAAFSGFGKALTAGHEETFAPRAIVPAAFHGLGAETPPLGEQLWCGPPEHSHEALLEMQRQRRCEPQGVPVVRELPAAEPPMDCVYCMAGQAHAEPAEPSGESAEAILDRYIERDNQGIWRYRPEAARLLRLKLRTTQAIPVAEHAVNAILNTTVPEELSGERWVQKELGTGRTVLAGLALLIPGMGTAQLVSYTGPEVRDIGPMTWFAPVLAEPTAIDKAAASTGLSKGALLAIGAGLLLIGTAVVVGMRGRKKGRAGYTANPRRRAPVKLPEAQIRWLVGRMHVGTPEEEVATDIRRRCKRGEWDDRDCERAVNFALREHRRNLEEYLWVMGSH